MSCELNCDPLTNNEPHTKALNSSKTHNKDNQKGKRLLLINGLIRIAFLSNALLLILLHLLILDMK